MDFTSLRTELQRFSKLRSIMGKELTLGFVGSVLGENTPTSSPG
jgi:hypothetical protein